MPYYPPISSGSSLPVADTQTIIKGSADATKLLRFEVDGFTAGATRVLTPPNQDGTIAVLEASNLFTVRQDIRAAGSAFAAGAYIPWITGDVLPSLYVGSISTSDNQQAIFAASSASVTCRFENRSAAGSTSVLRLQNVSTNGSCIDARTDATGGSSTCMYLEATAGALSMYMENKGTSSLNSKVEMFRMVRAPLSGTPLNNFGYYMGLFGNSSTSYGQSMGRIGISWIDATHASRAARLDLSTFYVSTESISLSVGSNSAGGLLSFFNATPVARPATYTLASTATRTMPTPEATFTGQDNAQAGTVYAKSADLIALQTRLDSVEGVLRQLIIDLASTSGYGLLVAS